MRIARRHVAFLFSPHPVGNASGRGGGHMTTPHGQQELGHQRLPGGRWLIVGAVLVAIVAAVVLLVVFSGGGGSGGGY
jgi:hypothetical protein